MKKVTVKELRGQAKAAGIKGYSRMKKAELEAALLEENQKAENTEEEKEMTKTEIQFDEEATRKAAEEFYRSMREDGRKKGEAIRKGEAQALSRSEMWHKEEAYLVGMYAGLLGTDKKKIWWTKRELVSDIFAEESKLEPAKAENTEEEATMTTTVYEEEEKAMLTKIPTAVAIESVTAMHREDEVRSVLFDCTKRQLHEVYQAIMEYDMENQMNGRKKSDIVYEYAKGIMMKKAREEFRELTAEAKAEYIKGRKYLETYNSLFAMLWECGLSELMVIGHKLGLSFEEYKGTMKKQSKYLNETTLLKCGIDYAINELELKAKREIKPIESNEGRQRQKPNRLTMLKELNKALKGCRNKEELEEVISEEVVRMMNEENQKTGDRSYERSVWIEYFGNLLGIAKVEGGIALEN